MSLLTVVLFVLGFVLLIGGAEILVRGAVQLAQAAGVSSLVIGLTVVAYGTSAPELAVTVQSVYADPPQPDLAIGNVVGSNISNVLLVLGMAALAAPLAVSRNMVRTGVPLMIAVSGLVWLFGRDGQISRGEGWLLFGGSCVYTLVTVIYSRRETRAAALRNDSDQGEAIASPTPRNVARQLALILGGFVLLTLGSRWLVDGAVELALFFGVSELVIGLTVVAIGTSLPEVATSVVAAIRGQRDIAVGNVVGSNLFNLLLVLGLCAAVSPQGVAVSPIALRFDFPIMMLVSLACLPIFLVDFTIQRWEGGLLLFYYAAYLTFLTLNATNHGALAGFSWVMIWLAAPLTLVIFGLSWSRAYRQCGVISSG